ncbi:zinc finger protein 106-like [Entelurus aequoreus]|uniref:zinc finger protein 106-like n=1 Tax=Entelurus aequoreus TaxID=161455 RepID=UPI002B1DB9DD|nr:zinc finger protein 106-like [Entelurus aequoreus]
MVGIPVKMARDKKCILCETVHVSKQEMDEHMRSMLHHRELEKLKGRDCGHECRVCKVSVVSLTDYAGHISSPAHKQHVEALEKKPAGPDRSGVEDYFDQALVDAILKRKEQIRKEKEAAAAAQLAKEQEEARKKEFQQRLCEAKERYQLNRGQQHLPHGPAWPTQHNSWNRKQQPGFRVGDAPYWNNNYDDRQGRSATWHAQAPPNFQRWAPGNLQAGRFHSQDDWGGSKKWERSPFCEQSRLPWLSNQGSNYGMYGRNNIAPCAQSHRPLRFDRPSMLPPPPQFFTKSVSNFERKVEEGVAPQRERVPAADCHQHSKMSFRSNPKLDKTKSHNVTKEVDSQPSRDASLTHTKGPQSQGRTSAEAQQLKTKLKSNPKSEEWSNSAQKDGGRIATAGPNCGVSAQPQSKATTKQMGIKTPSLGPLPSRQGQKPPELVRKAKSACASERRSSLDGVKLAVARQTEGEPPNDSVQGQITHHDENSCRQNGTKVWEELVPSSSESTRSLQSLQVSTSTAERLASVASSGGDTEKRPDKEALLSPPQDEVAQEGHSSESDTSRCDKVCLKASGASKPDLPPVFKRDLTKRVLEPNLNIARRVRNLSESRRSDTEKDSGLKPTVRQLISSSGARRKVNWEQVYQEVRKKQDKGKGMPRFGIEMVPNDAGDQSQEECDLALLENFSWESLMGTSPPAVSRKRSLSESSIAPTSEHSLFTSQEYNQTPVRHSEQQRSSVSPKSTVPGENGCHPEQMFNFTLEEAQKQADKLMSEKAKALQNSNAMLGDNSSGTEQMDTQGTVKRRRTPGDILSQESSCVEQEIKRRKIKSKSADRLHIDQLLSVSLREEELSRSLQAVDSNLIQARTALEAAFMQVQSFMVVKQQITTEMSSLRERRIELLKGMQGEAPPLRLKEEKADQVDSSLVASVSSLPSAAAPPPRCASPPSFSTPLISVKQEPLSPVRVTSESEPLEAAAQAEPTSMSVGTKLCQAGGESADVKDRLSGMSESKEKAVKAIHPLHQSLDSKSSVSSRRSSETGSLAERSAFDFEIPAVPTAACEPGGGKRVRKLKKRKVLEKAHGNVRAESSDTEMDAEASRPRWLRANRRSSGSTQVSTSSLPSGGSVKMDNDEEVSRPGVKPLKQLVLPEPDPSVLTEEKMDVTAAGTSLSPPAHVPDPSRTEQPSLACNEVTSTSDMDICKSSESEVSFPQTTWTSSYTSCGTFEGHQEAVNAMQVHNGLLYTCSGDRTIKALDLQSRKCVAVFSGHTSKVSCLLVSAAPCLQRRLYSGSSDQTIRCYNLKTKELEQQFSLADRVLCLHSRWKLLYAGLANGNVVTFDLTSNKQRDEFECHAPRAVSCLASYQEGSRRILLVGSYDSTISVRDAKTGLLLRTLGGHTKTVLCMKVVNDMVFSGSSDQNVYAHNIHSGELVRVYKGHSHAVTVVTVVGKVMLTACLDKLVRVYDLQSREQLQVYAGHSDMVTSMAVHQNKIYTGCYDGSVQAVELNLAQNYRCRWHGCSQVFGVMAHLQQHLVNEHAGDKVQTLRCRWRDCQEFFCARSGSKQGMLAHVQKHGEEAEPEP